ncbi:small integral membrane protein 20 isoform X1 [Hemitrygon akajei]|uniref:small integral membrane protein 20 isoform X1 n=1 Tax=Hemitrygon akajei TaxID=2704970 RepID=UPI003BF94858
MAKNLRVVLLFGGFAAAVGAAFYPIYFRPLFYTKEYLLTGLLIAQLLLNRAGTKGESNWNKSGGNSAWRNESLD